MEEIVRTAGYTGLSVLGEMHAFRAQDDRKKEMEEGLTKEQVSRYKGEIISSLYYASIFDRFY